MVIFFFLTGLVAHADCPAHSSDLLARAAAIEAARASQDQNRLQSEGTALRAEAACLAEAISPPAAARAHFAIGLVAFDRQDLPAVSAAFRSTRRIDPGFSPDPGLMPEGGRLRSIWDDAAQPAGTPIPVTTGAWLLDGLPGGATVPTGQQLYVQDTKDGRVSESYLFISGRDPLPPPLVLAGGHRSRWLAGAGGAAALLGAGGLAVAGWSRGEFREELDDERAQQIDSLNRASAFTGYGLAAASGGLIIGALVVHEW